MSEARKSRVPRIITFLIISLGAEAAYFLLTNTLNSTFLGNLNTPLYNNLLQGLYALLLAVAALFNRRITFRSTFKWYIAVPVVVLVGMLLEFLRGLAVNLLLTVVYSMAANNGMAPPDGIILAVIYGSLGVQILLWLVLSYLLQRFVLYRDTLDGRTAKPARPAAETVAREDTIIRAGASAAPDRVENSRPAENDLRWKA